MILVASAVPGANEALAAGQEARVAIARARLMTAELDRRTSRPLPESGRERGWATANRDRYAAECEVAQVAASALCARWDELMEALWGIAPDTASAVDAAVWGVDL